MYIESFTILPHFNYLGVGFITRNEEYTKHYYIEGERVCSKIGGGFGVAPQSPTGPHLSFIAGDASSVRGNLKHLVFDDLLCVGYNNIWNMLSTLPPALNTANDPENLRYFYHPDHLGSSSMISNISGRADQHIQYLPFGELFVSQRNSSFDSRYKFTAKELDNETNYTYFGARYYDSDLSSWISVDPMASERSWVSPYSYCQNNPVGRVDPTGALDVLGDYYSSNGKYLGSDGIDDDKLYIADAKNSDGTFSNARELSLSHSQFQVTANIIKKESSGGKAESLWIAHTINNAKDVSAIGGKQSNVYDQATKGSYSSVADKTSKLLTSDNSTSANNARYGLLDVLSGGADPTGGAVLWDGTDFLSGGLSHNKFKEYKSVSISRDIFDSYRTGVEKYNGGNTNSVFMVFRDKTGASAGFSSYGGGFYAPKQGSGNAYYHLKATGAQGPTIFWNIYK